MAYSQIRWSRGDYISLGKAVKSFNNKISEVQTEENKLYLPEKLDYSTLKGEIKTRAELKRIINSLNRWKEEGAEELYTTEAGEVLTKWERQELSIQARTYSRQLNQQLKELTEASIYGMGSPEVSKIQANQKRIQKIEKVSGSEFKALTSLIRSRGKRSVYL